MKAKSFRFRDGLKSLVIYRAGRAWRFEVQAADGSRRYVSRVKRKDIDQAARDYLAGTVGLNWQALDDKRKEFLAVVNDLVQAGGEADVLAYLRQRQSSSSIAAAVARFLQSMALRGCSARHVASVSMDLEAFAAAVTGKVADCTVETLRVFLADRAGHRGPARQRQVRGTLVQFFRWCRKEGYIASEAVTAADRLQSISLPACSRRVLSRAEFEACYAALPVKHRAWFLLGAWAGLRPEEAAPTKTKLADGRRGVSWEDVDFEFGIIRISPETSKVDRPRIVPMCDSLKAFLLPLRATGAICRGNPAKDETLIKLGKDVLGGRWPADCVRHSYGSYRNAQLRNLPQVAEEMGTSVEMLHRHYHNPRPGHEAAEWFAPLGDKQEVSKSG